MRLFAYYALHSFKNQLKKLLKTWVLIFLAVCVAFGVMVGLIVAAIENHVEETKQEDLVQEEMVESEPEEEVGEETEYFKTIGVTAGDMVELIAGVVILMMFVFMAMGADKSGCNIFLPADVNLLFPSPMRPQSVLMFRLATQLGVALFGSAYMLFQLPNLIVNVGLSLAGGLSIIAVWCFAIMFGTLLQVLLYALSSTYPVVKKYLRPVIYGVLALIAGGFLLFWKRGNGDFLKAAVLFFDAKVTRFVPIWGWMKGLCRFAVDGDLGAAGLCLAAILLGGGLLIYFIWHIKVDFYEDAMAKSEETAQLLERAQSEKPSGVMVQRKKDRSERLLRDGMKHGRGANVFFFKTMYNRFRFAHLGLFTKTTEFYLVVAVGVAVLCRTVLEVSSILPLVLTLGALSFFRALGNPLEQDTKMDYFILIPENTWAKLFWSLMGGMANCFLDMFLPMLAGALVMGVNPLQVLLWLPFVLSVDFYATTVGVFIDLSVPVAAGKMLKQIVQIMFVYFGLLPDIGILAVGIGFGHVALAVLAAFAINAVLGLLFFGLSPLFLGPCGD
ncbi:MAG: putative ABC exporter domain-containing protein [Acetatifactor sp.]